MDRNVLAGQHRLRMDRGIKTLALAIGTAVITGGTLLTVAVVAGGEVNVTMVVAAVRQDNSPVQIVGFRMPSQVGDFPIIIVQNKTSVGILDFTFMNLLGNPRAEGNVEPKWGGNLAAPPVERGERLIAPNGSAEFPEKFLRSHQVAFWAHRLRSNCLHTAVWVLRVKFVDGSVWEEKNDFKTGEALWRNSILPESTKACNDSLATRDTLDQLDGGSWLYPDGTPTHASTENAPFYVLACPIRDKVTKCPL